MLKMASSEEIWQPSIAVLPFLCSLYCLQEDCAAIMARLDSKETRLDLGWSIWNVPNHAKPFLHVSALICSLHDSQLCTCDQARRVVRIVWTCMDRGCYSHRPIGPGSRDETIGWVWASPETVKHHETAFSLLDLRSVSAQKYIMIRDHLSLYNFIHLVWI